MSRVEERAKAYEESLDYYRCMNDWPSISYRAGYEQAEKDLSLTIEDIELLHTFLYAIKNNKHGAFTFTRLSDEQYKEVLRRFKAIKEEENETK